MNGACATHLKYVHNVCTKTTAQSRGIIGLVHIEGGNEDVCTLYMAAALTAKIVVLKAFMVDFDGPLKIMQ
jgi:hypothetical protein